MKSRAESKLKTVSIAETVRNRQHAHIHQPVTTLPFQTQGKKTERKNQGRAGKENGGQWNDGTNVRAGNQWKEESEKTWLEKSINTWKRKIRTIREREESERHERGNAALFLTRFHPSVQLRVTLAGQKFKA